MESYSALNFDLELLNLRKCVYTSRCLGRHELDCDPKDNQSVTVFGRETSKLTPWLWPDNSGLQQRREIAYKNTN